MWNHGGNMRNYFQAKAAIAINLTSDEICGRTNIYTQLLIERYCCDSNFWLRNSINAFQFCDVICTESLISFWVWEYFFLNIWGAYFFGFNVIWIIIEFYEPDYDIFITICIINKIAIFLNLQKNSLVALGKYISVLFNFKGTWYIDLLSTTLWKWKLKWINETMKAF